MKDLRDMSYREQMEFWMQTRKLGLPKYKSKTLKKS
jgi:hypothetical protein